MYIMRSHSSLQCRLEDTEECRLWEWIPFIVSTPLFKIVIIVCLEQFKWILIHWLCCVCGVGLKDSNRYVILIHIIDKWKIVDMGTMSIHD